MSGSPPPRPEEVPSNLAFRILVLAAILALANAWAVRHLGGGLRSLAVVTMFTGVVGVLFALLRDRERAEYKRGVRAVLLRSVSGPVLVALVIALTTASAFVSSVTVLADGVASTVSLHMAAEGSRPDDAAERKLEGASDVTRYLTWTVPFGRPFYLEADGYLRHAFDLYPWLGATIRVSRDLRPVPAVLVRIPTEKHLHLSNGRLVVLARGESAEFPTNKDQASLLLGRRTGIPADVRGDWKVELDAQTAATVAGLVGEQDWIDPPDGFDWQKELVAGTAGSLGLAARTALRWKRPIDGSRIRWLTPRTTARVEFRTGAGQLVAALDFEIGSEPFQDLLLQPEG